MTRSPQFQLNGQPVSLAASEPTESLLRWLKRQRLHGTKEGCADGDCGACTVVLIEPDSEGRPQMQAVNSCLLPIGQLAGREVLTVEHLAEDGRLHPVQQALVDSAGSQCGYCTPGFVMSLFAGRYQGTLDDGCFEGNLCRCTGYQPIRAAAQTLRAQPTTDDRFSRRLQQSAQVLPPAALDRFHSPTRVEDALRLKSADPNAAWISGATDLGVELSHGKPVAPAFIALDRIAELQQLSIDTTRVRIGAGVSLRRLETELNGLFPALDQMLPWFAARQVRNRATLGGNLGTASPIGDLLPVLLALDASVHCRSLRGERQVPIDQFFLGYRKTALAADELITAVSLPRRPGLHSAAFKVAKRQTDDISIVAAVFALGLDDDQCVQHLRLAYGGVAAVPLRATHTETLLSGQRLDAACIERASASLLGEFTPLSDHRASADYRRQLVANLFVKFADTLIAGRLP